MKRHIRRISFVFLALLMLVSALPAFAAPVHASDGNMTVKVGFFAYPGYHELNDGVRSGYGHDFLMLLQRYTGLNYEFIGYENSWEEMQQMLLDGEIDMVTSARKTAEREKLFDFSEPIGTNSAQINVRENDTRFIPGDYASLDGIVIGEITGNSRNADVERFAEEKGFSYETREYSGAEELERALQSGQVDAAATSSLRKSYGEKTIAEFAPEEFYVIVKKGNIRLLEEINYGITQMDVNEGNWRDDLHYRNYRVTYSDSLSFTRREQDYIAAVQAGEKTITVSARPDSAPYSFVSGGELTGILPDYFAHLMDIAGLPYTTLTAADRDEYLNWAASGHADVIMDCCHDSAPSAQDEFGLLTDSYMTLTISRVTKKGFQGALKTVAAVDSQDMDFIDDDIAANAEHITAATPEEAMQAVKDGRADVCHVFTYTADRFLNTDPDGTLQSTILSEPVFNEHIYVSPNTDHELCSILNKCIKSEGSGVLDDYVKKYTNVTYETLTLKQYLRMNPNLVLTFAFLIVLVFLFFASVAMRVKTVRMKNEQLERELEQQSRLEEALTFTNFFLDTYVSAYYVDLSSRHYQVYKRSEALEKAYPVKNSYFDSLSDYINSDVDPEDRAELLDSVRPERMRELLRNAPEYTHTFRSTNSGIERIIKLQVIRGADENHAAFGFVDITEELQEQQKRLLGAARDAAVISGLSDDFSCVVYVNYVTGEEVHYRFDPLFSASIPGWERITVFDERIRILAETLVHPDDLEFFSVPGETKRMILESLKKDGVYYHNFRVIINDEIIYYQLKLVMDDQLEDHLIAGFRNVDDTVRREMEYQERLEAANRSKTDFLFNMSHDIRTPMNAIIGFTQLAKKHIDDRERVIDSLSKIESSGNHLLNLINEVLDMSRVEAGKLHSEMKTVNVTEAALRLITICRESAEEHGIELNWQCRNIIHPIVNADELHVNQIIMNILGNAIKYTPAGGRVSYTVEELPYSVPGYGEYVFTVEDTGIGMSGEYLKHIYESFSREDNASTSSIQGTGLGMSIVKRLVDYMDGNIDIESQQGEGTKVAVTLHLLTVENEVSAPEKTDRAELGLSGRRILLVEDNELNREIATEILQDMGVEVEEAVNGLDAVEHVKSRGGEYYDFILMDIQMPLMDGFDATREIRRLPHTDGLPIIALSANAFEEDRMKSLEAGMNAHVAKPIVISDLISALSKFMK